MSSALASEVSLAGRYRLVRRLASGGMGQVWRATDELLRRPVAVELLRSKYAEDPAFLDRFRAEARRTAALSHPGIASVFDYGETEGTGAKGTTAYLVMELVEGEPLSVLLAREGRLTPSPAPPTRRPAPTPAWSWAPPPTSRPSRSPAARRPRPATCTRSAWSPTSA